MAETATAQAIVETRRARIASALGRGLDVPPAPADPLTASQREYLLQEAEELYWNELAWEELTEEETVAGGHLTELVFPGFLAFVEGLLNDSPPPDFEGPESARPEVVEDILLFLAERHRELSSELEAGADSEQTVWARAMTLNLIDLVLYRLHGLSPADREIAEPDG